MVILEANMGGGGIAKGVVRQHRRNLFRGVVLSKAPALFFPFAVANLLGLTLFFPDPPSLRAPAWGLLSLWLGWNYTVIKDSREKWKWGKRRGEMQGEAFTSCLRCYIPSFVLPGLACVLQNLQGKPNDKWEQHVCYSEALSLNVYTSRGKRGAIIRLCARQIPGQRSRGSARATRSQSHWKINL